MAWQKSTGCWEMGGVCVKIGSPNGCFKTPKRVPSTTTPHFTTESTTSNHKILVSYSRFPCSYLQYSGHQPCGVHIRLSVMCLCCDGFQQGLCMMFGGFVSRNAQAGFEMPRSGHASSPNEPHEKQDKHCQTGQECISDIPIWKSTVSDSC